MPRSPRGVDGHIIFDGLIKATQGRVSTSDSAIWHSLSTAQKDRLTYRMCLAQAATSAVQNTFHGPQW